VKLATHAPDGGVVDEEGEGEEDEADDVRAFGLSTGFSPPPQPTTKKKRRAVKRGRAFIIIIIMG
jgi:hypothetical protein